MADTTFSSGTVITSDWLNDINDAVYTPIPRTAGEISAGITPTDYSHPLGDIRRYGAVVDGTTDDADAIDAYLSDPNVVADCVQFVKDVYHMPKDERDGLLYTNEVGENSAKIGARPTSQTFVANLTKKWLHDADNEGYEVVLIDGRALTDISREMDAEGLCEYRLGLYFVCDYVVGARRTLGYAAIPYDELTTEQRDEVDTLVAQIKVRNQRDFDRDVERLARPDAPLLAVPDLEGIEMINSDQPMAVIDTSAEVNKTEMSLSVAQLVARYV